MHRLRFINGGLGQGSWSRQWLKGQIVQLCSECFHEGVARVDLVGEIARIELFPERMSDKSRVFVMSQQVFDGIFLRELPYQAGIGPQLVFGEGVGSVADVFDAYGGVVEPNDVSRHNGVGQKSIDRAVSVDEIVCGDVEGASMAYFASRRGQKDGIKGRKRALYVGYGRPVDDDHLRLDGWPVYLHAVVTFHVFDGEPCPRTVKGDGPIDDFHACTCILTKSLPMTGSCRPERDGQY